MAERPRGGRVRWATRELFLGLLGLPGDGRVPARGWLRWATIAFYVALALVVFVLIVMVAES